MLDVRLYLYPGGPTESLPPQRIFDNVAAVVCLAAFRTDKSATGVTYDSHIYLTLYYKL